MTTVLNGSTIIYNRDGTTIDTLTAQGNNSGSSSATIVRSAEVTVVILTAVGTDYACNLPSNAEVGDIIEIFSTENNGWVYLPSGDTFIDGTASFGWGASVRVRKVSATEWAHS